MTVHINHSIFQFRSYSHEQILLKSNHHHSDSNHSVDLFTLVNPTNTTNSSLSSLICSICSLPMMKPTLLPCQHTFCYKCLENNQHSRAASLPLQSTSGLLVNENPRRTITCQKCLRIHHLNSLSDLHENQSMELLINTLLCETCHQLYPSNQLDTCLHCFGVLCPNCYDEHLENHQKTKEKVNRNLYRIVSTDETVNISQISSDKQIFPPRSLNDEQKVPVKEKENLDPSEISSSSSSPIPKKKSNSFLRKLINPSRHRHSQSLTEKESLTPTSDKPISSTKLSRRPQLKLNTNFDEISKLDPISKPSPITPVRRFLNLFDQYTYTAQYIEQCKQRQSELDRAVKKLIEVLTLKTTENLNQISSYWMYIKEFILNQYEIQSTRIQILDYLFKSCCSTMDSQKQMEFFLKQNDEINAELQVLSSTLSLLNHEPSSLMMKQLFDREEQTIIRTIQRHLESLLSNYADELSFIIERIHVYESRFSSWKNSNVTELDSIIFEWTQIIQHDYPTLIEKLSNDFLTKIPQLELILLQMLKNMKKRLLNTNHPVPSRRTSDC